MSSYKQLLTVAAIIVAPATIAYGQADPIADLSVENASPPLSNAGTDVPFDVIVTNNGPDPAVGAVLTEPIPTGMTFVSGGQNGGTPFTCSTPAIGTSGPASCTCPSLASGASATFRFVFHIDPAAAPGVFFTSVATIVSATFDPNEENSSATTNTQTPPLPAADLRVTKVGPSSARPGTDVVYTIEVINGGPGDATNVILDDVIPAGMTFMSLTQTGPALSCNTPAVGSDGTITCTAAIFVAGIASLTVTVHLPPDAAEGGIFQGPATVRSDYDPNVENDAATPYLCVQIDSCQAGPCPGTPVVCAVADQCHVQATCDTITGACPANPPKTNGSACTDGNGCTQTDTCQAGVCTGTNPVVCPTADQCHDQATCDTITGACPANPPKTNGSACTDGNGCTQTDTCQAGVCTGANPVACPTADQCHDQATCDTLTGVCPANPPKTNGSACTDGNGCTQTDTCQAGVCTGTNPVVCPVANQCHAQESCNTITGTCPANPLVVNGAPCDDGNACTQIDSCLSGVCTGSNPAVCPPPDQCHVQGTCDSTTGICAPNPPRTNGTSCDDGNVCTQIDSCQSGVCQGGTTLNCDDGNPCTIDSCDIVAGCGHTGACDAGVQDAPVQDAPARDGLADGAANVTGDAASDARTDDDAAGGRGDGAATDARPSSPDADARPVASASGAGCSCRIGAGKETSLSSAWLALLGLFAARRFRARRPNLRSPRPISAGR